jgi:DNA-binding CsgD family transcriptional regulator
VLWRQLGSTLGIITCLEGLAAALASGSFHTPERDKSATCLWAAAEAQREAIGSHRPLADSLFYTPFLQGARAYLGEDAYAIATRTGRALPLEQAIAYARQVALEPQEGTPSAPPAPAPGAPSASTPCELLESLSDRELEVLRLVASGLADKVVAARLIISPRTVHAHLASIYSKLGVNSRHAATMFAIEHQLISPSAPR